MYTFCKTLSGKLPSCLVRVFVKEVTIEREVYSELVHVSCLLVCVLFITVSNDVLRSVRIVSC